MRRRVRLRVAVRVAIMMNVGCGPSVQNQVKQKEARSGVKMVRDKCGCG